MPAAREFREIDKGPTFEVYEGEVCVQRLDWTRDGAVRSTVVGHYMGECADSLIRRFRGLIHREKSTSSCSTMRGIPLESTAKHAPTSVNGRRATRM